MIREELKKIWRPGVVLALIIIGFVFYTMYLEFYINVFPENYGGPNGRGVLQVSGEWVEKYGTSLSVQEMEKIKEGLPGLELEADRYVREYEAAGKHGLETYAQFEAFMQEAAAAAAGESAADQNENYADAMRLNHYLGSGGTGNIAGRRYAARLFADEYDRSLQYALGMEKSAYFDWNTKKEYDHARQAFFGKDNLWQNILPGEVPEAVGIYAGHLLVWICLSICLLLSPLLVHDRLCRMQALQYSSKRGRGIWKSQFAAVMFSAFLLATLNLAIFGGLFAKHGTSVFFPCKMYSFMAQPCWPDWTHGMWCLVLAGMCYLVSFGTAGAVFFLSQNSANYIIMLLKVLPLFVCLAVLCPNMMEQAFYYGNPLYRRSGMPYIEIVCAAGALAAGLALSLAAWRRVKKELC